MGAEQQDAWARQPRETKKAYDAFRVYIRLPYGDHTGGLGVRRSMAQVARIQSTTLNTVQGWGSRWHWVERAQAYDDALVAIEYEEQQIAHRAWARQAQRNLAQVRQDTHRLYGKVVDRVTEMLDSPLYVEVREELEDEAGELIGVEKRLIPADWNFNTVPRLISSLVALAEITTTTGGTWDALVKLIDYDALSDEQLEAISAASSPDEIIRALIGAGPS